MFKFAETTPERAAEMVARIEAKRAEAAMELESHRLDLGTAVLAAEEGLPKAPEAVQKARQAIAIAEVTIAEADASLAAAKARHAEALKIVEDRETEAKWQKVRELGERRAKLAQNIEKHVIKLCDEFDELKAISIEQFDTAPSKELAFLSSEFSPTNVTTLLRHCLFRNGFSFACRYPWGKESIPDFTDKIKDGNAWLLKHSVQPEVEKTVSEVSS